MDEARRVHDADRQIPEFDVYELDGGRWQAVHKADHDLTLEHSEWPELFMACVAARVRFDLQRAAEELVTRMAEPGRAWRHNGPGSGINV
ncbi:hypothetical protein [Actinomadura sp. 9N215]|uniref:hypothetical protein n=1 Tax=Actinomadura sp. 9N215 TaxID=3375150 RepID=UPI0037A1DD8A